MNAFTHPTTRLVFALALCGACEWPMAQAAEPAPMPTDAAPAVTAPAAVSSQSAGVVRIRKERTQAVQPQAQISGPVAPVGFRDAISEGFESFQAPARPVTMTQAYAQPYSSQAYTAQPVAMHGHAHSYPVETVYTDCPNGECDRHGYCKERFHEWLKYKFGYFIPTGNGDRDSAVWQISSRLSTGSWLLRSAGWSALFRSRLRSARFCSSGASCGSPVQLWLGNSFQPINTDFSSCELM